ncbi:MAG: helix-hairpin-helix domain-containing protein [Planctomycetota bacterium]
MISRLTGAVLAAGEFSVEIQPEGFPMAFTVMVPSYYEDLLRARIGQVRTLYTLCTLDGNANGSSFVPKLVGFPTAMDRRFFEMLTQVKGLGAKRAMRLLVRPPHSVALAIGAKDKESLQTLPEVGKKLADTIVHELFDKVQSYLAMAAGGPSDSSLMGGSAEHNPAAADIPAVHEPFASAAPDELAGVDPKLRPVIEEAVGALVTLGENRKQAAKLVTAAIAEVDTDGDSSISSERILAAAFRNRDG